MPFECRLQVARLERQHGVVVTTGEVEPPLGFPRRKVGGLTVHAFESSQPARLKNALGAGHFAAPKPPCARRLQFAPEIARGGERMLGRRLRVRDEHADVAGGIVPRRHGGGQLTLANGAIEARRASRSECEAGEIERRRVGMVPRRGAPAEGDMLLRNVPTPLAEAEPRRRHFDRTRLARRRAVLELPMPRRHFTTHGVDIHIADNREHGVVGAVPASIKRQERCTRERTQLRFITHTPAPDPMPVKQRRVQRLDGHRRRGIALALGLLNDHFEFARQLPGVDHCARVGIELNLESLHKR